MRTLIIALFFSTSFYAFGDDDTHFHEKLSLSLRNIDKSVKVLRKQISESQMAPFLADLYLQLADLLSQKSLTLYYVQMEHEKAKDDIKSGFDNKNSPVVVAQKEAIGIYQTVVHDFPSFPKRTEALYKLALSLKAIDENAEFIRTSNVILREAPTSEEAMKTNLLLGQHFFDQGDFEESFKIYKSVSTTTFPYERNLALYKMGLIYLAQEKFRDSLHQFEVVINDPDLKVQENPYDLKKKSVESKGDLKRDVLIDSIRAYTFVFKDNPDPVAYYSKLCPSEFYFQETMEKLAMRYIFLKKYELSVRILRAISERSPDPQKVLNIYHQVLLIIPTAARVELPVTEMRFVLERLKLWWSFYYLKPKDMHDTYDFFENQVRELATFSHDSAKKLPAGPKKTFFLERARDYYQLYNQFFERDKNNVKMATNLADVYFLMEDFFHAGEYYLKVYHNEFGSAPPAQKRALLENSILALQKKPCGSFYDRVRMKGLLIQAVQDYMILIPSLRNSSKVVFLLLKARYEQSPSNDRLEELFAFIRKNKSTPQAKDASEIILDYFNTLNDFTGLSNWASRILTLNIPDPTYNAHLRDLKKNASSKAIEDRVKSISNYDEFASGKSYLTAALSSGDATLKSLALQQALASSKREHDFKTFIQAAGLVAKKERDPGKKSEILTSIAQESIKIGHVYHALSVLKEIINGNEFSSRIRLQALEQMVDLGLQTRDKWTLEEVMNQSLASQLPANYQSKLKDQLSDFLDSPSSLSHSAAARLMALGPSDESSTALFKAQMHLDPSLRQRVRSQISGQCGNAGRQLQCLWIQLERMDSQRLQILSNLKRASPALAAIEQTSVPFMGLIGRYQKMEGGEDSHFEAVLAIRSHTLYDSFAQYLKRAAAANPSVKADLMAKANESTASAQHEIQKCNTIRMKAASLNPATRYCNSTAEVPLMTLVGWPNSNVASPPRSDHASDEITALEKDVFSPNSDADSLLRLCKAFYDQRMYYHSNALSSYGAATFSASEGNFKAILGCGVLYLGLYNEASYHLKNASDYLNIKQSCLEKLNSLRQGS